MRWKEEGSYMVKFERKETEKARLAIALLQKAKEKKSTYNTPEVNEALCEIFHGKCYICENKNATSSQIEHLRAHKENIDLKYDWNNLFWSCAHCNNIKSDKFEPILDCTKEEIDNVIAFRKEGYFGTDERLVFEPLDNRPETINTVQLLNAVYNGTTAQKKIEARVLRKGVREELAKFKGMIRDYEDAEGEDKEDLRLYVKKELKNNSAFTSFKRWLIKDHKEYFSEFLAYLS